MLEYDFENSVGVWVCSTAHVLRRALDTQLSTKSITLRQWEVLAHLAKDGELSQCELADRLGIEPPTLAGVVNRMERDGWLERKPCDHDRRRNLLSPTKQAETIWNKTVEICHAIRAEATRDLTAEDLDHLNRICATIRKNLGDDADVAVAADCDGESA